METLVRLALMLLGCVAVLIGAMIILGGPHWTATVVSLFLDLISLGPAYSGGLDQVNTDNEMRFYSVFWAGYGVWVIWLAKRLRSHSVQVWIAIGVFWLGGVARSLSVMAFGLPDPLFIGLWAIELIAPLLVALAYRRVLRST